MSESNGPKAPGESEGAGGGSEGGPGGQPNPGQDPTQITQQLAHNPVSARVPDKVARGVFSTGVIILDGPFEFVLDFVMNLTSPRAVVARVVLSPTVAEQFVAALRENIGKFEGRFGPIPPLPRPQMPPKPPTIQEIYEDLKLSEETQAGAYANAVMIGHGASEFTFDFITRFFPNAAVSSRVFLAAPQVPRMLETLQTSLARWKARFGGGQAT
ncbi:MAG TPA: DUF3467 domain-containing protein [Tepidisphaeraceae bacterium]|nr:DUF3467 domain-containing protein [Tepidisphaeraceae bacterium]